MAYMSQQPGRNDYILSVWRLSGGKWNLSQNKYFQDVISAIAFYNSDPVLLVATIGEKLTTFTVSGEEVNQKETRDLPHTYGSPAALAVSQSGKYMAVGYHHRQGYRGCGGSNFVVDVFGLSPYKLINTATIENPYYCGVSNLAFSPTDDNLFASGDFFDNGYTRLWRLTDNQAIWSFKEGASSFAFSPDGNLLIYLVSFSGYGALSFEDIYIRAIKNGELLKSIPVPGIKRLALSPDGTTLVTGDQNGLISVWQVK
jgi:WD40 repeat protein